MNNIRCSRCFIERSITYSLFKSPGWWSSML